MILPSRVLVPATRASLPGISVDITARKIITGELLLNPLRLDASVIVERRVCEWNMSGPVSVLLATTQAFQGIKSIQRACDLLRMLVSGHFLKQRPEGSQHANAWLFSIRTLECQSIVVFPD